MKTVQVWKSPVRTDRVQSRAQDRFCRFIGIEVQRWECEMQPAGDIRSLQAKWHAVAPGKYYVAKVTGLRNGAPAAHRSDRVRYFPDAEAREAYIRQRINEYNKKVAKL